MKKLNDVALKLLAKAAYANAEKEANSACLFIGYQPKMPQKVKELKERLRMLIVRGGTLLVIHSNWFCYANDNTHDCNCNGVNTIA